MFKKYSQQLAVSSKQGDPGRPLLTVFFCSLLAAHCLLAAPAAAQLIRHEMIDPYLAADIPYAPSTGADWNDPDPESVHEALDALAAGSQSIAVGSGDPSAGSVPSEVTGMLNADLRRRAAQAFA